jgi:hypothetical protein
MEPLNTPLNDDELKQALQQWRAPNAPASLELSVLPREPWWRWLLTGSVRIPVPVGLAVLLALVVAAYWTASKKTEPTKSAPPLSLADFQPVESPEPKIVRTHEGN